MTPDNVLYNLNIERAILSAIVFDPKIFENISSKLTHEDFYLPFHQEMFGVIGDLQRQDMPIDEDFIMNGLQKSGKYDEEKFFEVMTANPISDTKAYIEDIKERARTRKLKALTVEIQKQIGSKSVDELLYEIVSQSEKIPSLSESFDGKPIDTLKEEEPQFFIKDWLPIPKATITLINAGGGTGKTWTALQLALRIEKEEPNAKIFLWLSEDPLGIVKGRLKAIKEKILIDGVFTSNNIVVSDKFPPQLLDVKNNNAKMGHNFYKIKRDLREYDVIIFDPLLAFYGGDENSNSHARVFMQPFMNWAKDDGKSIIFLHHSKKSGEGEGRARGAGAIVDASRCVYDLEKYIIKRDGRNVPDPQRKGEVKFILTKDNYGAGRYLDSFVFSRKVTPAETTIEVKYEEEPQLNMPVFN